MTLKNITTTTALVVIGMHVAAQYTAAQYSPSTQPQSYKDYYASQVQTSRRSYTTAAQYTYDRIYYRSPAVSPYMNLMRPGGQYISNYQTYVRPEQKRRDAQAAQQHKAWQSSLRAGGTTGLSRGTGTPRPSNYQNQWYGGRQALGLHP